MFQMKSNTILHDTPFARLCQFRSAHRVFEDKVAPHAQQLPVPTVLAVLNPAQPAADNISLAICDMRAAPNELELSRGERGRAWLRVEGF